MFYDKKIKYLNYIVDGERVKGCGFVKVELRDKNLSLEVSVSGLPQTLRAFTDVWLCAAGATYPVGQICLESGGGSFRLSNCNVVEVSPTGVAYEDWKGISIFPQAGCEISALWGEHSGCVLERVEVSGELSGEISVELQDAETEKPSPTLSTEDVTEQENAPPQMRMAEDKWEQISAIYPHIRPFRDKREYLSIRPADFVLLSAESYKAVNNSFLMHGYHNYQHLILARSAKKGELSYYVGAPGNFFEREKQVAIMFGFTGFECAKDPAREGDFGYYLMQVEL